MRPKVAVLFKMKSKPLEELKKWADVDVILYSTRALRSLKRSSGSTTG